MRSCGIAALGAPAPQAGPTGGAGALDERFKIAAGLKRRWSDLIGTAISPEVGQGPEGGAR